MNCLPYLADFAVQACFYRAEGASVALLSCALRRYAGAGEWLIRAAENHRAVAAVPAPPQPRAVGKSASQHEPASGSVSPSVFMRIVYESLPGLRCALLTLFRIRRPALKKCQIARRRAPRARCNAWLASAIAFRAVTQCGCRSASSPCGSSLAPWAV